MRKVFRKIHLWLSLPLGLIITVICLSGATLVFRDDIDELTHHDRYYAKEVVGEPISMEILIEKVNEQLTDNSVVSVKVPSDSNLNYVFGLAENRSSAYVDPYTGKLVEITQRGGDDFFGTMLRLHRWLLDESRDWGKPIVGYTTLLFVFITITGIFVWWPKTRKQLKTRLQVKTKYGMKRFWLDMHTTAGMYICVGLLALSLTGLTYSFRWYNKGFYNLLGVEVAEQSRSPHGKANAPQKEEDEKTDTSHWSSVLAELKRLNPDFKTISIQDGSATVVEDFTFGNSRASDKYSFDSNTGKITNVQLYKDQDRAVKVRGWVYSIHIGAWGGLLSKILTCVVALIGASLPLTGYYMFYVKRKRKFKKKAA